MAVEDRPEVALDLVGDGFTQALTSEHARTIAATMWRNKPALGD